jgi:hypothetical protein
MFSILNMKTMVSLSIGNVIGGDGEELLTEVLDREAGGVGTVRDAVIGGLAEAYGSLI